MANLALEFCGVKFKNPVVIASIETTNSPEVIRECVDAGAGGMIIKTLTDIEDMARLTQNSKYAILNEKNEPVPVDLHIPGLLGPETHNYGSTAVHWYMRDDGAGGATA